MDEKKSSNSNKTVINNMIMEKKQSLVSKYSLAIVTIAIISCSYSQSISTPKDATDLAKIEWWKKTTFYHIYVRSFKDTTGSGTGDLRGIIEKLDYLKSINAETLLMSPFYTSPMKDAGYDISDYRDINELFGSMADFDDLLKGVHNRGMRLVIDFVPNHTSDQHEWFQRSERALEEPEKYGKYRDYYVWSNSTRFQDPKYGGRPSNWISSFGGETAWEWSSIRKEFYLHQFMPQQPDLNLRNPQVREELKDIARFWLRKGVDGLRIDAAPFFFEDEEMRDEPVNPDWVEGIDPYEKLLHPYTHSLDEDPRLVRDWYEVANEPEFGGNRIVVTEGYTTIPKTLDYYGPNQDDRNADMPFNFELMKLRHATLSPRIVEETIMNWLTATEKMNWEKVNNARMPWSLWVTGNHDNSRLANRIGSENLDAFLWLQFLLPGTPVVYYGDEIGLNNCDYNKVPEATIKEEEPSRLIFRAPMAWDDSLPSGGFSNASTAWLPMSMNFATNNVKLQSELPQKSNLKNFIGIGNLRREHMHTIIFGEHTFFTNEAEAPSSVFAMAIVSKPNSGSLLLLINFDDQQRGRVNLVQKQSAEKNKFEVPKSGKVLLTNIDGGSIKEGEVYNINEIELEPNQAAVLKFD